jgi:soluble lytic murein transglycosylase-like protein
MARDAHIEFSHTPAVSMSLGQQYIEHLMDLSSINDNLIFVIGAYNAGPGTMSNWQRNLRTINDPLLFVESIPSPQTRDYVVRVMGNYWVYSEMLGRTDSGSVGALAHNQWPHYERTGHQMVAMVSHLTSDGAE